MPLSVVEGERSRNQNREVLESSRLLGRGGCQIGAINRIRYDIASVYRVIINFYPPLPLPLNDEYLNGSNMTY